MARPHCSAQGPRGMEYRPCLPGPPLPAVDNLVALRGLRCAPTSALIRYRLGALIPLASLAHPLVWGLEEMGNNG